MFYLRREADGVRYGSISFRNIFQVDFFFFRTTSESSCLLRVNPANIVFVKIVDECLLPIVTPWHLACHTFEIICGQGHIFSSFSSGHFLQTLTPLVSKLEHCHNLQLLRLPISCLYLFVGDIDEANNQMFSSPSPFLLPMSITDRATGTKEAISPFGSLGPWMMHSPGSAITAKFVYLSYFTHMLVRTQWVTSRTPLKWLSTVVMLPACNY